MKISIVCREHTPAALLLARGYLVSCNEVKVNILPILSCLVLHHMALYWISAHLWRERPKISLHRSFRSDGHEECHRRGKVLFCLGFFCRMDNTCALFFILIHSEASWPLRGMNVFNRYLAEERHRVSRFKSYRTKLSYEMEKKKCPKWFHFWMKNLWPLTAAVAQYLSYFRFSTLQN